MSQLDAVPVPGLFLAIRGMPVLPIIIVIVAILGKVREPESSGLLLVVRPDQGLAVIVSAADTMASPRLHTPSGLEAGNHVRASRVFGRKALAVRVASRQVQKVDTGKSDKESTE